MLIFHALTKYPISMHQCITISITSPTHVKYTEARARGWGRSTLGLHHSQRLPEVHPTWGFTGPGSAQGAAITYLRCVYLYCNISIYH